MSVQLKNTRSAFPFDSHFADVFGSRVHYVRQGVGKPIVFLHGIPTWSYVWRNVLPHVSDVGRCIAVDLIGFGRSDRPDIAYRFNDHYRYVAGFIERLGLDDLTIVGHDWGAAIGLRYAMEHPNRVARFAFMEAVLPPVFPKSSWADMGEFEPLFRQFRDPIAGHQLIVEQHVFIEGFLPQMILRPLSDQEHNAYREPFADESSRKPIRVWPQELPIDGQPADNLQLFEQMTSWWLASDLPKLMIHATPGAAMPQAVVEWSQKHLKNLDVRHVGRGLHYIQEDCPREIGESLADWVSIATNQNPRNYKEITR